MRLRSAGRALVLVTLLSAQLALASSLRLIPSPEAGRLPVDVGSGLEERIVRVADVAIETTSPSGGVLVVDVAPLVRTRGGMSIGFEIALVDDGQLPGPGDFRSAAGGRVTWRISASGHLEKDLYLRFSDPGVARAGHYSGRLQAHFRER